MEIDASIEEVARARIRAKWGRAIVIRSHTLEEWEEAQWRSMIPDAQAAIAAYQAANADWKAKSNILSGNKIMAQHPIYGPLDTDEQIEAAAKRIEAARNEAHQRRFEVVEKMIRDGVPFAPAGLRYAATARCPQCKAGLAYPLESGPFGSWYCSERLLNPNDENNHHDTFPFAFYSIKSEDQPSAQGATTRPKDAS